MNKQRGTITSWILSTFAFLVVAGGAFGLVVTNQRSLIDWFKLYNYKPTSDVSQMATQDAMTNDARHIWYVNHPSIQNKTDFSKSCPTGTKEQTIVLGCYIGDQNGIYLLNVTDTRLYGVKQVTAAHEMLHAAYDRMSIRERSDINTQLLNYYHNGLTDERIKKTIDAYKITEPNDVVNEMHSIFGTEIATLPSGLEQHYKQYFTDRTQVTNFSARYQAEFTSRKNQVAVDDKQLALLKTQIDNLESDLDSREADIKTKQANLENLRSSNSISAYNAGVAPFNALVVAYNAEVEQVRVLINQYNVLVHDRNATAVEEDQLIKGLSADNKTINN